VFSPAQLDQPGLGHNTFTQEALALIVRCGEGLLRRTRNLCLGSLVEAVRDQTRIVDLKQVNRVLIRRRLALRQHPAGVASKPGLPGWLHWCRCFKSAILNW
jgi:hypothetical protein